MAFEWSRASREPWKSYSPELQTILNVVGWERSRERWKELGGAAFLYDDFQILIQLQRSIQAPVKRFSASSEKEH